MPVTTNQFENWYLRLTNNDGFAVPRCAALALQLSVRARLGGVKPHGLLSFASSARNAVVMRFQCRRVVNEGCSVRIPTHVVIDPEDSNRQNTRDDRYSSQAKSTFRQLVGIAYVRTETAITVVNVLLSNFSITDLHSQDAQCRDATEHVTDQSGFHVEIPSVSMADDCIYAP